MHKIITTSKEGDGSRIEGTGEGGGGGGGEGKNKRLEEEEGKIEGGV